MTNVPPMTTTNIMEVSPKPNQIMAKGTQTILGTLCKAKIIEPTVSSSVFTLASNTPKPVPMTSEMASPMNRCRKLAQISRTRLMSITPQYNSIATDKGDVIIAMGKLYRTKHDLIMIKRIVKNSTISLCCVVRKL